MEVICHSCENPLPMSAASIPLWEWIWMIYGSFSALVHCTVLLTIYKARKSKTGSFFRGPFFTIVLIQGVHEILEFLTVNLGNRLRKYRIIQYALEEDNNVVEWQWYWFMFIKNVLYLGHFEIAANRLSAFVFRRFGTYDRIWNGYTIFWATIIGYSISAGFRAVTYSPSLKCTTFINNGSDTFSFFISTEITEFDSATDMSISLICAVFCIVCYGFTMHMAKMQKIDSVQSRKREMMLLKCGVVTFFILLPSPIRSSLEFYFSLTRQDTKRAFMSTLNLLPAEAMCVFQPWLLLLSCASLRQQLWSLFQEKELRRSSSTNSASVTHT